MARINRKVVGGAVVAIGLLGAYCFNLQSSEQNQVLKNEEAGLEKAQQLPSHAQFNASLPTIQSEPPDLPGRGSTLSLPEISP